MPSFFTSPPNSFITSPNTQGTGVAGALAGDSQSAPKVKEMITALAENRNTDVKALMHPQIREQAADQVTLIDGAVVYLNVVYLSNNEGTGLPLSS